MSYVFPPNRDRNAWPIDPESLNENFQEVLSEVQGNLGEHNWQEDSIPRPNVAISEEEAPIVCWSRFVQQSPWSGALGDIDPQTSSATYGWKVPNSREWSTIAYDVTGSEFSKTLTTRNGLLWIMASFQQHGRWDNWTSTVQMPGVQYAIAVDGNIIHETIPGCLDYGNDPLGAAVAVRRFPFVLDALYPISSGEHTIEVKCRLALGDQVRAFNSDTDFYMVADREFLIIELR